LSWADGHSDYPLPIRAKKPGIPKFRQPQPLLGGFFGTSMLFSGVFALSLVLLRGLCQPFPQYGEKIRPDLAKSEAHAEAWTGINDRRVGFEVFTVGREDLY